MKSSPFIPVAVDALAVFETVWSASLNRLNSLYGADFAAERAGDIGNATQC